MSLIIFYLLYLDNCLALNGSIILYFFLRYIRKTNAITPIPTLTTAGKTILIGLKIGTTDTIAIHTYTPTNITTPYAINFHTAGRSFYP